MLWEKTNGSDEEEMGRAILLNSDGGFFVLAYRRPEENRDIYMLKLNGDGDTIWEKIVDSEINVFPISIDKTSYNGYIVSGYKIVPNDYDAYIAKFDGEGNLM
ncbi:MAG: hypothetical protein ACP5K2_08685 [bacterium]